MKKTLIIALVLGLLAGSMVATADAKKKKKKPYSRVVEGSYTQPAPGIGGVVTLNGQGGTIDAPTLENEMFLNIEITDDSGQPVYWGLSHQDENGDGAGDIVTGGCGNTETPLEIVPGYSYTITITAGPGAEAPTCPGVATAGTVKLTFTEVP